jgi:anti-anti-sigma factor
MGAVPGVPASRVVPAWQLTVAVTGDSAVVTAAGELDRLTSAQLDAGLSSVEAAGRDVTVDLRAVTFMDSSAVHLLVRHAARAGGERFVLTIIAPPARVARVLDIAGVTDMLPLIEAPGPLPDEAVTGSQPAPAEGDLQVLIEDGPEALRIALAGPLDLGTVPKLREAVDVHVRAGRTMIIDLSDVELIDSLGLAALVRVRQRARTNGGRLQLVAAPYLVHAVFVLTGLHALFDWVPATTATRRQ